MLPLCYADPKRGHKKLWACVSVFKDLFLLFMSSLRTGASDGATEVDDSFLLYSRILKEMARWQTREKTTTDVWTPRNLDGCVLKS